MTIRVTDDWNEQPLTLCFVDDAANGGCLVQCPSCANIFNSKELEGEESECPGCGAEAIYPGWASW